MKPLKASEVSVLFDVIGNKLVFASGFGGGLAAYTRDAEAFDEWAQGYFPFERGLTYAVHIATGPYAGKIVGTASIVQSEDDPEACELGWSGYDPRVWNTAVNAETKLILLNKLFSDRCQRVRVHHDNLNLRQFGYTVTTSESLPENFDAKNSTAEILRSNAHSANTEPIEFYEIHREDWPNLRNQLQNRVKQHRPNPALLIDLNQDD